MATCRDCLHDDACRSLLTAMGYAVDGDGNDADERCDTFKTKTKYTEVVYCKDCKHLEITGCYGECNKLVRIVRPDDFCSYGERREGE